MKLFQRMVQFFAVFSVSLTAHLLFSAMATAASDPLAEVDVVAITSEEVEKTLAPQLSKLEEQIYSIFSPLGVSVSRAVRKSSRKAVASYLRKAFGQF